MAEEDLLLLPLNTHAIHAMAEELFRIDVPVATAVVQLPRLVLHVEAQEPLQKAEAGAPTAMVKVGITHTVMVKLQGRQSAGNAMVPEP